jgi:hypothetical protein
MQLAKHLAHFSRQFAQHVAHFSMQFAKNLAHQGCLLFYDWKFFLEGFMS